MDHAPRRDSYGYNRNGGDGSYDRRMNRYRQPRRGGGYGGRGMPRERRERGRMGSPHTKQSNDPDPKDEWRRSLKDAFVLVGDFSRRTTTSLPVEDNVKALVAAFTEQELFDDPVALPPGAMAVDKKGDPSMVDIVVEAAGSLGMQSSIYALLTALASSQEGAEQFSVRVLDGIFKAFLSAFSKGAFVKIKLLLRFMGELCNCGVVDGGEFGRLLQGISGDYVAAGDAEVCQPVKDLVCYVVLAVLPWCGSTLKVQWSSGLDALIEVLGFHMENRLPVVKGGLRGTFVRSISKENESDDNKEEGDDDDDTPADSLQMLWALVRAMHKQGWKESSIPKSIPQPWRSCVEELSNVIPTPLPDDLSSVSLNKRDLRSRIITASSQDMGNEGGLCGRHVPDSLCHAYTLYIHGELELFDEDSGPFAGTIGSLHPKEKLVLCDFVRDVLACMQPVIQTDGTRMGSFSSVVEQLLSIEKLSPSKCCFEYLIIELMLQALLIVPQPPCWSAYIQRVLLELCRVAPDTAPRALAFTTGTLFHEIPAMDTSVILLFGSWFGYYLKDISTNWPLWSHWLHLIQADPHDPQRIFLCVALHKFAKLSGPDRVRDAVPEELWPLALLPDAFDSGAVVGDKTICMSNVCQGSGDEETEATPDPDPTLDTLLIPLTAEKRSESEITDEGKRGDMDTDSHQHSKNETISNTLDIPGVVKVVENSLKDLVSILRDENNTPDDVREWMNEQASVWGEQNGSTVPERSDIVRLFELYYGGREMEVVLRAILRAAGPNPFKIWELLNRYKEVLVSPFHVDGRGQKNEREWEGGKPNPTVNNNETQQAVQTSLLEVIQRAWPTREEGGRQNVLPSQMFHSTVDALLAEKVVSPLAIVSYAFSSSLDNCVYDVLGGGWGLLDAALYHAKKAAAASEINGKAVKDMNEMDCSDVQMEDHISNKSGLDSDVSAMKTAATSSNADEVQLCSELILRCTDVLPLLAGEKRFIASCLLRRILRWCLSRPALAMECLTCMRAVEEHGGELDDLERGILNFAIDEATAAKCG